METQQHAQQHARPDAAYHSRLLNTLGDAVLGTDSNLIITAWNDAAEALYGWRKDEAIGRSIYDIMRVAIPDAQIAALLAELNSTGYQHSEAWHYRRDGKALFVDSNLFTLKDDNSEICGYIGVHRDITEQRKAVRTLEDNERRFRALIEHSCDAISLLDVDGKVLDTTPVIETIFGYTPAEFKGLNVFDLIHDEDIAAMRKLQEQLLAQPGLTAPVLVRARRKDGSWRWIEGFVTNLLAEPAVTAIVANYRDVTRRKQAEESAHLSAERLKILLDMDKAILAAQSTEEIATAVLSRLVRLTPCRRASVSLGDETQNMIQGDALLVAVLDTKLGPHNSLPAGTRYSPGFFTYSPPTLLQQGEIEFVAHINSVPELPPLRALKKDGIAAFARVPLIAEGNLIGTLNLSFEPGESPGEEAHAIWQEVAGRLAVAISQSRLHHQVQEGRRQLQALSRRLIETQEAERRHLARELHDEIGQALTAIRLSLQRAQTQSEADDTALFDDCTALIEDALSHVRDLSLDLRPSLLDDLGLIAALRWYVDRQAKRSGLRLQFSAHGIPVNPGGASQNRMPPEIETACFRVAQEALTNILRHASAHSAEVKLQRIQDVLELEVRDDGCGFDSAAAHQHAARGNSLGLLGMEERVRLVGGEFALTSTPGQGTCVAARFPLDSTPLERRILPRATLPPGSPPEKTQPAVGPD